MSIRYLSGLTVDSTVLVVDAVNDRVGIGTASPASLLNLSATTFPVLTLTRQDNGTTAAGAINFSATSSVRWQISTNNSVGNGLEFNTADGSGNVMYITRTGNVGIGTTSPAHLLDVSGTARILNGIYFNNATGSFLWETGANALRFGTNNTERMRIDASGNVGIGTTAPAEKLQVIGNIGVGAGTYNGGVYANSSTTGVDTNWGFDFLRTAGQADYSTRLKYYPNTGDSRKGGIWNSLSNTWVLYGDSNNTPNVIIPSGNVGIGTTSPGELLEVVGNIRANVSNGGGFMLTGASASGLVRAGATGLALRTDTTDRLTIDNSGAATFSSSVTASSLIKTGGTSAQYLMADGSVSTLTNPVTGTGTANYIPKFTSGSAIGNSQIFDNGTNVGIGTAAPFSTAKLQVKTATDINVAIQTGTTNASGIKINAFNDAGSANIPLELNGSILSLKTGETERMHITSAGLVGIGTTTPGAKLEVSGNWKLGDISGGSFKSYTFGTELDISGLISGGWARSHKITTSDTSGNVFFGVLGNNTTLTRAYWTIGDPSSIDSTGYNSGNGIILLKNGNVGIGTTAPVVKLHVADSGGGRLILQGVGGSGINWQLNSYTDGNLYIGNYGVADYVTLTSTGNVGIGTTAPGAKLQIGDYSTSGGNTLAILNSSGNQVLRLADYSAYYGFDIVNDDAGYLHIIRHANSVAGTSALTIKRDDGNVGIGTTSPASILHVSSTGANAYSSTITKGSNMKGIVNTLSNNGDDMVGIYFGTGTDAAGTHWSGITGSRSNSAVNWGTQLNFYTHNDDTSNITDATQKMVIKGNGNVGIGTTAPLTKLSVHKTTAFSTSSLQAGEDNIFLTSATAAGSGVFGASIGFSRNGFHDRRAAAIASVQGTADEDQIGLAFFTHPTIGGGDAIAEAMRISYDGNVGIGTTNPGQKLHLRNGVLLIDSDPGNSPGLWMPDINGNPSLRIVTDQTDASYTSIINAWGANTNSGVTLGTIRGDGTAFQVRSEVTLSSGFATDSGTTRFIVLGNGNVGIGTTGPITKLSIGAYSGSRLPYINATANTFDANGITVTSSNTANAAIGGGIDLTNNVHSVGSFSPLISFSALSQSGTYNNNYAAIYGILAGAGGDANWNTGHIVFATAESYGASEKMRITSGGLVGIGTTSPAARLHVVGTESRFGGVASGYISVYNANSRSGYLQANEGSDFRIGSDTNDMTFYVNGSERVRFTAGGNVGIGTTSPEGMLTIGTTNPTINLGNTGVSATDALIGRAAANDYHVTGSAAGDLTIRPEATKKIVFGTTSTAAATGVARMTIDASGNVGIGTTSPATALQVNGTARATRLNSTGGVVDFDAETGNNFIQIASNIVSIANGGNVSMTITATGNVGIGTTAPGAKLDIGGNATGSVQTIFGRGNDDSNFTVRYTNGSAGTNNTVQGTIGLDYASGTWADMAAIKFIRDSTAGILAFYTSTSATSGTERMRITSAGNVGIGTTSPTGKLDIRSGGLDTNPLTIYGTTNGAKMFDFRDDNAGGTAAMFRMYNSSGTETVRLFPGTTTSHHSWILPTGNFGIGTASPSEKLFVNVGAGALMNSTITYGTNTKGIVINQDDGGSYGAGLWFRQSGLTAGIGSVRVNSGDWATDLRFYTHPSAIVNQNELYERMRINSEGNVGIGTTSPSALLHVSQASANTVVRIGNNTTYDQFVYFNGNNDWSLGMDYSNSNAFVLSNASSIGTNDRVVVTTGGNVGIGTTSPQSRLDLSPPASQSTTSTLGYSANAQLNIRIPNSVGDVGQIVFTNDAAPTAGYASIGVVMTSSTGVGIGDIIMSTKSIGADAASTERMRITSGGNVGIGTTAPSAYLDVKGLADTAGVISLQLRSGNTSNNFSSNQITLGYANTAEYRHAIKSRHNSGAGAGNAIDFYIWNNSLNASDIATNPIMSIDTTNVGIGTTAPTEKLHVDGSTLITYNNSFQSTNSVGNKAILARVSPTSGIINYAEYATATNLNGFVIGSDDARVKGNITGDSLEFITNTSTRMTILSGGNVGINTTTPGSTLHVIGDVLIQTGALGVGVNPNATDGRIDASNDIVAFSTSDRRLKENITPIANALEKVRSLTGVEFDWKEETKSVHGYEGHDTGIIAQEVQAVMPTAVRTNDSGYLSVRYEKMIALLVEAMKEQQAQIEELKKLIK